jgi:hypoxanthine phosphoribosyltransferase
MPEIYQSVAEIAERVEELGRDLRRRSGGDTRLLLVAVLKGAALFFADLARALPGPQEFAFVRARSYGDGTESSGEVKVDWAGPEEVAGRAVVVVDTILDTGHTLSAVTDLIRQRGAASILTCVLLDKPSRRVVDIEADLVGFTVPDVFLVGYGLDYAGEYRGLPYLATL